MDILHSKPTDYVKYLKKKFKYENPIVLKFPKLDFNMRKYIHGEHCFGLGSVAVTITLLQFSNRSRVWWLLLQIAKIKIPFDGVQSAEKLCVHQTFLQREHFLASGPIFGLSAKRTHVFNVQSSSLTNYFSAGFYLFLIRKLHIFSKYERLSSNVLCNRDVTYSSNTTWKRFFQLSSLSDVARV